MQFYDNFLAVLPFSTKTALEDLELEAYGCGDICLSICSEEMGNPQSYVINLFEMGIRNVKDYTFLHGYYEPTLAILYEPTPTWAGYGLCCHC